MQKLAVQDLMKLEDYARERSAFRQRVLEHKKHRRVALGEHITLLFEDRLTIQAQVQEMLRIERIFEPDAIQQELDAYTPLIPDGSNLKATCLIEYEDLDQRRMMLELMRGIEHQIWLQVADFGQVTAIADEDLERSNSDKTSAVHFLRFELGPPMIAALRAGKALRMGVNHAAYSAEIQVDPRVAAALSRDFDTG